MKRRTALIGLAAALSLPLAGASLAQDKKTIAGIVFQQDQYFKTVQLGMAAEAKTAGVSCSRPTARTSWRKKPS